MKRPNEFLESIEGDGDPAHRLAHESASALLHRIRESSDPMTQQILAYADEHGIDDVAELWADARANSLPGALWRVYLLRHVVAADPDVAGYRFKRGLEEGSDPEHAIAGAPQSPNPTEVRELADTILAGAFTGDFAGALERAAAFCRIEGKGAAALEDDEVAGSFLSMGDELATAARAWRAGLLE